VDKGIRCWRRISPWKPKIEYEFELEDEYDWGMILEQGEEEKRRRGEASHRGAEFLSLLGPRTIVFFPSIVLVLGLELVLDFCP
jgi:hypothetical protein